MTPDPVKTADKPLDFQVLDCVVKEHLAHGGHGATCTDVVLALKWHHERHHEHGTVSKRLSELAAAGRIAASSLVEPRVSPLTKRPQTVWFPTSVGLVALASWRAARRADAA